VASECVDDVDVRYSMVANGNAMTLCLDYDWAAGQCITITAQYAAKSECTTKPGNVRPQIVVSGAVDSSYCESGGVVHPVRKFTMCVRPA
jgi:hypothetical protein